MAAPNPVPGKGHLHYFLHALLLCLLLPALFPGVFFRGEIIAPGDVLFQIPPWKAHAPDGYTDAQNPCAVDPVAAIIPWYRLAADIGRQGEWPLWNPLQFGGMPLLANYQSAVLYPPRLLHLFLDTSIATTLFVCLKLWWCGMAAYLCGCGIGLRRGAARFFSIAWMLASFNILWANWPLTDVASWLPILFLGTEFLLLSRWRAGFFTLVLAGPMALLAGHPETTFTMSLGLGVYFVLRLALERRRGKALFQPIAVCACAAGATALLASAQLLPFLEYLRHSAHFTERPSLDSAFPLPPSMLAGFFVPRFFGFEGDGNFWGEYDSNIYGMIYPGIAVWLCAFVLFLPRLDARTRHRSMALTAAGFLGAALAWSLPPFDTLHALPLLNKMLRCHHLGFCAFALPLLGALGLNHLIEAPPRPRSLARLAPPIAVSVLLLVIIYTFFARLIQAYRITDYVAWRMGSSLAFLLAGLLLFAVHARKPSPRLLAPLLTLLLAADLLHAHWGTNATLPAAQLYPRTQLTDYLATLPEPARISAATGNIPAGFMMAYGIEEWNAYDGLYPKRMMHFQRTLGTELWTNMEPVCGIGYYLHYPRVSEASFPLDDPGRFERVAVIEGLEVYRNARAFPRAFLVPGIEVAPDSEALFARMREEGYDPAKAVLTDEPPSTGAFIDEAGQGNARVTRHEANRVLIETEAPANSVLVLSDAYFPGWHCKVDGVDAEVFPAYYVFRGVVLSPGKHTVEFQYRPLSFYCGLGISLATLVAVLILAYWTRPARHSVPQR